MTQIIAVGSKDRIIALADGKATVVGSSDTVSNARKIFQLSDNVAMLVSGHIFGWLPEILDAIPGYLREDNRRTYSEIIEYMDDYIQKFDWKFKPGQSIIFIVLGYQNDGPNITMLRPNEKPMATMFCQASGSWDQKEQYDYVIKNLPQVPITKFEYRNAEKFSIRMLSKAESVTPDKVGGQELMWHVFPDRIEKKTNTYTDRLRKVYCKNSLTT